MAKILRSRRIPPEPRRSQSTWREFVRQHAGQMLATDFFTVETAWLQRLHVLFFIEIASRKVHLGGITASPTGEWVAQQARNLAWKLQEGTLQAKFLLRDCDCKFTAGFDRVFRSEEVEVLRLPHRAPRANSIAERFVGPCRRELLDHLLIFSARHLEAVIKEFLVHDHQARPHQGLEQRCPEPLVLASVRLPVDRQIVRHDRLAGLLHEYSWGRMIELTRMRLPHTTPRSLCHTPSSYRMNRCGNWNHLIRQTESSTGAGVNSTATWSNGWRCCSPSDTDGGVVGTA